MDGERWTRVRAVFEEAVERHGEAREALLDEACAGDADLRAEVDELLAADELPPVLTQVLEPEVERAMAVLDPGQLAGKQVGGYRIERLLAAGGMGAVYEAEQDEPRRRVAVKTLRVGLDGDRIRRRFRLEVEVLARLEHPGIARIYEAGTFVEGSGAGAAELPWFAMEYVEGARDVVSYARDEQLTRDQRLELLLQVCDAVHHGHTRGVVHRDLKPGNLLVGRDGQVKVIDFGVARMVAEGDQPSLSRTAAGQLVGTLQYMSPEQLGGRTDEVGTASDVYALGLLMAELLTGRRVVDLSGLSLAQAASLVQDGPPPDLAAFDPSLPSDLTWIVRRAVEKEPGRRYASVAELASDVRRWQRGEPVLAGPPTARYRASRFVRRHRVAVAGGVVVLVSLVAGLAVALWGLFDAREQADRAENVAGFLLDAFLTVDVRRQGSDARVADVLDGALAKLEQRFPEADLGRADALAALGNAFGALGRKAEAVEPLSRALEIQTRELGRKHPQRVATLGALGFALLDGARAHEAVALLREHHELVSARHGALSAAALDSLANLARGLDDTGQDAQARVLLEDARAALGVVHDDRGRAVLRERVRLELGALRVAKGLDDGVAAAEAARLLTDAVATLWRLPVGGDPAETFSRALAVAGETPPDSARRDEHVDLLDAALAVGGWVHDSGGDGAEGLLRGLLHSTEATYGDDHRAWAAAAYQLARVLGDPRAGDEELWLEHTVAPGRRAEAERLLRRGLALVERDGGSGSRQRARHLELLARLLVLDGQAEEAAALVRAAHDEARAAISDPVTMALHEVNLGASLSILEDWEGARDSFRPALDVLRRELGDAHIETRHAAEDVALLYDRWAIDRDFDERLLREGLAAVEDVLAPGQARRVDLGTDLAVSLRRQGRPFEGLEVVLGVLADRAMDPDTRASADVRLLDEVGAALYATDRLVASRRAYAAMLVVAARRHGVEPDARLVSDGLRALLDDAAHDGEVDAEAVAALMPLVAKLAGEVLLAARQTWEDDRRRGAELEDMLARANNVATTLIESDHAGEAVALMDLVIDSLERLHGPGHPHLAPMRANQSMALRGLGRLDEAAAAARDAWAMALQTLGEGNLGLVEYLRFRADLAEDMDEHELALELWREALALAQRHVDPSSPWLAELREDEAEVLLHLERLEEAEASLLRALDARLRQDPADQAAVARLTRLLAGALEGQGRTAEADALRESAGTP